MTRFVLALTACLLLAPSLAAQSVAATADSTYESYIASYNVNADGTYTDTTKYLLRFGSKGDIERINPWRLAYNSEIQSIEVIEAYTLKRNGKRVLVPVSAIQTQLSPEAQAAPEFSSLKIQVVTFPDVKPGDAIYMETRLTSSKQYFEGHFELLEVFPVNSLWKSVQVNVSAPPNYKLYWDSVDMEGGTLPDRDGRAHWQWNTQIIQTIAYEVYSTSMVDYSPRLAVSSFPNYEALGAAYWAEAGKKVAVTTAIQQLADEITKGASDSKQQARAIYEWVNKNIRYVAIMIGRGAFIPHDVLTILKNRYGDCKDYVTILQSLLAAKGIESLPVLVRADDSFWFPKAPAIVIFNHVILYMPTLDVYADATSPNTGFGLLPQVVIGKHAVLAGGKTGKAFIPAGKPDENQIRSQLDLAIQDNGGMKVTASTEFRGRIEMVFRHIFAEMKPETSNFILEKLLEEFGYVGKGNIVEISNSYKTDESLSIKAEFDLVNAVKVPGPAGMTVPQGLDLTTSTDLIRFVALEQRKTSLFAGAFKVTQQSRLTFPQSLNVSSVPTGVNLVNAAGYYQSSYENENGVVTIRRELIIKHDVYTPKEYPALRELITRGVEDIKAQIQYGPAGSYKRSDTILVRSSKTKSKGTLETTKVLSRLGLATAFAVLSQEKVFALESMLLKNPDDIETRVLLIRHYSELEPTLGVRQTLLRHRKWLIENRPEKDFKLDLDLYTPVALQAPEYQELKEAWLKQVELKKHSPAVMLNAASFIGRQDSQMAETLLQKGQQIEPDDYRWAVELGELYAKRANEKVTNERAGAFALSLEQFEKALALNKKERSYRRAHDRISILQRLGDVAFDADQMARAKQYATELLLEFGRDTTIYSRVEIAHDENIMLGRIALREGDIEKAKGQLIVAGRAVVLAGKERRTYFIPKMSLAKELFEKNEKQVVLEYLELFVDFSTDESKTLTKWATMIRKGETPSFDYYAK